MRAILPILEYHNIDTAPEGCRLPFLYVSPRKFKYQLSLLKTLGVRGLALSKAIEYADAGGRRPVVAITFDDAYRDVFEHALPTLKALGFSATCYAVSRHIGDHNAWDAEQLGVRKPTMSAEQLRAWQAAGMEVGAHTRSHPRLSLCSEADLDDEIAGSKRHLQQLLDCEVTQFCYPYGDFTPHVVETVRAAGFHAAVTTVRGRARLCDDRFLLRRIPIHGNRALATFLFRALSPYEDIRR